MSYPLICSPEKRLPVTAPACGNGSSHIRGDWDKILLYLIKCSLAPCSGYLGKQKQEVVNSNLVVPKLAFLKESDTVLAQMFMHHGHDGILCHWNDAYT